MLRNRVGMAWLVALLLSEAAFAQQTAKRQVMKLTAGELFKKCSAAVVTISTPTGFGSGILIDSSGVIVTNLHVVQADTRASVKLANGDTYDDVAVVDVDARKDLILLKVKGFKLPAQELGDSDNVSVGDHVYAIGAPQGLELSLSEGIVSSVRDIGGGYRVIQTTAAISPGSSGGGLFDDQGRLVGITSFKRNGGENLNFAVPVNYFRGMLDTTPKFTLAEINSKFGKPPAAPPESANPEREPAAATVPTSNGPRVPPVWGPSSTGSWESHSLVVVYREAAWQGRALEPRVVVDDVEVATMDNKRFFAVWLTPGTHALDTGGGITQSCYAPLSGDFQANYVYFMRVELVGNCFALRGRNPEVAKAEVAKLKPLNQTNVKHQAVFTVLP